MLPQPRANHIIDKNPIKISTTAHCFTAVRKQIDSISNTFSDGNVQSTTPQIVDQKHAIGASSAHNTHNSSHRLLHKRHFAETGHTGGLHCCVFLHLVKCGRDSDTKSAGLVSVRLSR